ncbi:invasion associated locus B family protein, partial [Komagataeibacter rhaeticus]
MQFRAVACAFLFSAALAGVSHAAGTAAAQSAAPSPAKGAPASPQAPAQPSPITTQQTFGAWQANCTYAPATRAASLCVAAQQLSMQQQGKA